ncbi:MAG: DUF6070 family protein [Lachnospiraceae bacterium]|nr:DUF6070 family protein [Lachnospiraceae bacterium]
MNQKKYLIVFILACSMFLCYCSKAEKTAETIIEPKEEAAKETAAVTIPEKPADSGEGKGYGLPVPDQDREEAGRDSCRLMLLLANIYKQADKGDSLNAVLSHKSMKKMVMKIKKQGYPVTSSEIYSNMENHKQVHAFLKNAETGKKGSVVIYKILLDGSLGRNKYIYNGTDMYILTSTAEWDKDNKPCMSFISYTKIKKWRYSDKGWFCYELCVPEYPDVMEVADGSYLIRIKPMGRKKRRLSKQCVQGLGYQGNNLLCSNWNENHLEKLDYNGLYEYLYKMKYKKKFDGQKYPDGIPKDKFESLVMEYLPVSSQIIQKAAAFDKKKGTYLWQRLGCFNYAPDYFGTSIPEVTGIKKNPDGTVTLAVDAVCEMVLCNEAIITHELTVRFAKDGSFQYLGNKILNGGIRDIPEYQYRFTPG